MGLLTPKKTAVGVKPPRGVVFGGRAQLLPPDGLSVPQTPATVEAGLALLARDQPRSNQPEAQGKPERKGAEATTKGGGGGAGGAEDFFEATINVAEALTGLDLDGDGDIGLAGHNFSHRRSPKRMASIYDVLLAATHKERTKFFSAGRRLLELEEMVENSYWLSPNLLRVKLEQRDGPSSWSAWWGALLQGRCMQLLLIILLLLDVGFVCAEIFVEAYHPECKAIRRTAVSCCSAGEAVPLPTPALMTTVGPSGGHHLHSDGESGESVILTGFVQGLTDMLRGAHPGGDATHGRHDYASAHTYGCAAPLEMAHTNAVACDASGFWTDLHIIFSVASLLILVVFALEILLLLCTFRELFLRSVGMLVDIVVISLALWLQQEVRNDAAHHSRSTGSPARPIQCVPPKSVS